MNCAVCNKTLSRRNVSGLCRIHALRLGSAPEHDQVRRNALATFQASNPERVRDYCTRASRSRLSWCPPEYQDAYRHLTRKKQMPAADARRAIEDLIAAHAERYRRTGQLQQAA